MREEWESNSRYTGRRTERRGKRRKRHRIRRIIKGIFCVALIIPMITAVLWAKDMITGKGNLGVMALVNPKVREVMAHKDQYPEELIQLLEGNAEITIDGKPHTLCGGEAIVMPESIPHSVKAVSRFKMYLTVVKKTE